MALSPEQNAYCTQVSDAMDACANLISQFEQQASVYTDRAYGVGGANEITDADLTASNFEYNANDLANGITLMQQLRNFRDNLAVVQGDYGTTLSKLRKLT